jgi:hypothetical protein
VPDDRLPAHLVLRARLTFAAQGGAPVHAPVVLATIGALHARFIVDTGSDVHLITRELANDAGLQLARVDSGTDHSGSTVESSMVGDVAIAFEGAPGGPRGARLTIHDVVAIPAPEAFTSQGIGGILSPHRLHAAAFAVIDELAGELLLVDAQPEAMPRFLRERHPAPDVLVLKRRHGDHRPIVDASIEPHPRVPMLVNTGGRHTEFEPGTVPGLASGPLERIGTGVSGAAVMGATAGPQIVRLGTRGIAVPSLMLRSGMGDPPAMLGQDVLRGAVLAVGPDPATPVFLQVETVRSDVVEGSPDGAATV